MLIFPNNQLGEVDVSVTHGLSLYNLRTFAALIADMIIAMQLLTPAMLTSYQPPKLEETHVLKI